MPVIFEIDDSAQILIGDTFGDMGAYLSQSDVVVIGGSFSGKGGQSPIEPALPSKPLVADHRCITSKQSAMA